MQVPIEVDYPLYIPEYLLKMKAKERVKYLMSLQGPTAPTVSEEQLREAPANQKMQGVYAVRKPGPDPVVLIVPCMGGMTAAELRYHVGMYTEGGYGQGPELKSKAISKRDWQRMVTNTIDYLVETRKDKGKVRIAT